MSQLPILSVSPREQLPISSDGHGMSPSSIHSHLPHHVHAQVIENTRRGDVPQPPHPQTAIGPLTARVDLPVLGHNEEGLGSAHELDWAELPQALAIKGSLHLGREEQEMLQS